MLTDGARDYAHQIKTKKMFRLISKTKTGTNQLTLDDAKVWLRVDGTDEDDLITALIDESRGLIEAYLDISMVETTVELLVSARYKLDPPFLPVVTITSVVDIDGIDVDYTWDGFYVSTTTLTNYTITYDSGYTELPVGLMLGWKEVVALMYENRGDDIDAMFPSLIMQNENLMPYRNTVWFG